jgi:ABC-2 type transport system ATP-binding protein
MDVRNLKFKYKKSNKLILNDVSFTIKPYKLNVVVGLNGAGKTTLFDCLVNILKPLDGKINIPPIDQILYLTQTIHFSNVLKGKDFVKFIYRLDNRLIKDDPYYYMVDLDERGKDLFVHLWNTKIGKMSVGEKRWLFITMVSSLNRKLFIFDEPTSGVDPSSRLKILQKLELLIKNGSSCLISTHQLQDISNVDCNIIMLHEGKVKFEGGYNEWLKLYDTENPDIAFERSIG